MDTNTVATDHVKPEHGIFKKLRANICKRCPLCKAARNSPKSLPGRFLQHPVHSENCPAWKAYNDIYGEQKIL